MKIGTFVVCSSAVHAVGFLGGFSCGCPGGTGVCPILGWFLVGSTLVHKGCSAGLCSQAREHGCFPSCRREDPVTSCLGRCRAGVEWTVAHYIFLTEVRNVVFLACPVLRL